MAEKRTTDAYAIEMRRQLVTYLKQSSPVFIALGDEFWGRYMMESVEPPSVVITDNGFTANVIEGELHDPGDDPTT